MRAFNTELDGLNELKKLLKREACSPKLDPEPSEAVKALARPLISEPLRVREPTRVLKSEVCSANPEAEPRESLRIFAKLLV